MTTASVALQQYRLGRLAYLKGKQLRKGVKAYYKIGYHDAEREEIYRRNKT